MSKKSIFYLVVTTILVFSAYFGIVQANDISDTEQQSDSATVLTTESEAETINASYLTDSTSSASFKLTSYDDDDQIIAIYQSASPSVVNITSVEYVNNRMLGQLSEQGIGSGFVYDTAGHIITNYHVVEGADELIVTLSTGEKFDAVVVGVDVVNDLAVISIDAGSSLPNPLRLANSDLTQVGETVMAIGNPYGLDWTLTTGVVSALGRVIESTQDGQYIADAIQTDAAINPGNSGGPLLNMAGEVIGITSQIISESGSSSGLGFAISANTIQRIVPAIIQNGQYQHPWLGLQMMDLTEYSIALLEEAGMDIPVDSGILVIGVNQNSPASKAGIQAGDRQVRFGPYIIPIDGDIITEINGTQVKSQKDLMVYLESETTIGDVVQITVYRDGGMQMVPVKLDAQSSN